MKKEMDLQINREREREMQFPWLFVNIALDGASEPARERTGRLYYTCLQVISSTCSEESVPSENYRLILNKTNRERQISYDLSGM